MDSNIDPRLPLFFQIHTAWARECKKLGIDVSNTELPLTEYWNEFCTKCGLQVSPTQALSLTIVDQKKWLLTKIKYGV